MAERRLTHARVGARCVAVMPAQLEFSSTLKHISPAFWGALRNDQGFDNFCISEKARTATCSQRWRTLIPLG